jgi:hypothetical protein
MNALDPPVPELELMVPELELVIIVPLLLLVLIVPLLLDEPPVPVLPDPPPPQPWLAAPARASVARAAIGPARCQISVRLRSFMSPPKSRMCS